MSFVSTLQIMNALKARLEALPHPDAAKALAGEKLFERVFFHENKKLREALRDLTVVKQRVAMIVPSGFSHENIREGRTVRSVRTMTFDLLAADRAWTKGGHEAVFGGENNVGVLTMGELVINALVETPQLGLPYVTLAPTDGQMIEIADEDVKDVPGRECVVIGYETPAGEVTITPTQRWPAA